MKDLLIEAQELCQKYGIDNVINALDTIVDDPLAEFKQAFATGKKIQMNIGHTWVDVDWKPCWDLSPEQYRVKPQPHKFQKEMDAYAAGKTVQVEISEPTLPKWIDIPFAHGYEPKWKGDNYRVKPENIVVASFASPIEWTNRHHTVSLSGGFENNVRFTFDPDTKKLIKVELLP